MFGWFAAQKLESGAGKFLRVFLDWHMARIWNDPQL